MISLLLISAVVLFWPQPSRFSMKAVIVDQLSLDFPNNAFVDNATVMLQNYGFNVSYVSNQSVTVDFFHELAKGNYGVIVLRTHTAMRNDTGVKTVDIFTSELFSASKHVAELDNGQLVRGILNYSGEKDYFAVTSDFIRNVAGSFPKSVIVMMGCWSNKPQYNQVAQAFVSKGATVCTGWSEMVTPEKTDTETLEVMQSILQNETIEDSIELAHASYVYYDENGNRIVSKIEFYPQTSEAAALRLSGLVAEAMNFPRFELIVLTAVIRRR